jgi:hypothetical protein
MPEVSRELYYSQKFVACSTVFAGVTAPLYELAHQKGESTWEDHHEQAFVGIKGLLTSPPCLAYHNIIFILDTDASDIAIGAVLSHYTHNPCIAVVQHQLLHYSNHIPTDCQVYDLNHLRWHTFFRVDVQSPYQTEKALLAIGHVMLATFSWSLKGSTVLHATNFWL